MSFEVFDPRFSSRFSSMQRSIEQGIQRLRMVYGETREIVATFSFSVRNCEKRSRIADKRDEGKC
jgi:hypothetical protein